MAEFPALPIWTDALLADAGYLSDSELGLYLRLLILTWRSPRCRIPNDGKWIANKLNKSSYEYDKLLKPLISEFFKSSGNYLYQKRLLREFRYIKKRSKKQSVTAKIRWDKEKDLCHGNATLGIAPTPTPTPTPRLLNSTKLIITNTAADDSSAAAAKIYFNGENAEGLNGQAVYLSPDWVIPDEWGHEIEIIGVFTPDEIIREGKKFLRYWKAQKPRPIAAWRKHWHNWFNTAEESKKDVQERKRK